jgi:translation initiation factor 1
MFDEIETQLNLKKVVIQVQRRNGRQCFTIVSDIAEDLDSHRICRYLKKTLNCGGNILKDKELGEIMRLTGDQKQAVINFFIEQEIYKGDEIIVKGV